MKPYYEHGGITIYHGDCRDVIATLPDNSIDAVVTDPPYELTGKTGKGGFMGKKWDGTGIAFNVKMWEEVLRVLKPGGHVLSFGGARTYHRMACAIEDAGFEVRDQIMWVFGSGFPKSLNVSKAIDKQAGAERKVIAQTKRSGNPINTYIGGTENLRPWQRKQIEEHGHLVDTITAPATTEAKQWEGWGTALKPAHEPICMAETVQGNSSGERAGVGYRRDQCGWLSGGGNRRRLETNKRM